MFDPFRKTRHPRMIQRNYRFDFFQKLIFGWSFFVFILILAIIGIIGIKGYVFYTVATNPELIGEFIGRIFNGFNQVR